MVEVVDPNVYFGVELLGGTLGALGGGLAGFFLGLFACLGSVGDGGGYASLACIGAGVLGYGVGTPLGATAGVGVAGQLNGVRGNVWLSLAGATAGEAVGLVGLSFVGDGLLSESDLIGPALVLGVIPLASGLGATLGYNVGARVVP